MARSIPTGAALALCAWAAACSSSEDTYDRNLLLKTAAAQIANLQAQFAIEAENLHLATHAWESSIGHVDTQARQNDAQAAFKVAMATWQKLELMQVGPAGNPSAVAGGALLRDDIYSWPNVSPCKVDQELLSLDYFAADYFSTHLNTAYGLDALEYLLFYTGDEDACEAPSALDENEWSGMNLPAERSAMSVIISDGVVLSALELALEFDEFREPFENAGHDDSVFATAQEAVDNIFAALFYIDLRTKDQKIAVTAGLHPDCPTDTCPESRESRYANISLENIKNNLTGFDLLFFGGEAEGLDDFLRARGADDAADSMRSRLDAALSAADAVQAPFAAAIDDTPEAVEALHSAVTGVTDLLKSQVVTTLNLSVPAEGAGDND